MRYVGCRILALSAQFGASLSHCVITTTQLCGVGSGQRKCRQIEIVLRFERLSRARYPKPDGVEGTSQCASLPLGQVGAGTRCNRLLRRPSSLGLWDGV